MKYVIPLSPTELTTLQQMSDNHPIRRVRIRAHALKLSDKGFTMPEIAIIYSTDARTVSGWIQRWETEGVAGLYDRPREGRPSILTPDEQRQVIQWIQASPKEMNKVRATIQQHTQKQISRKTIKRIAKKKRLIFKRIRKSPKKRPSEKQAKRGKQMIDRVQKQQRAGAIDLRYFDVTGFCLVPPVPYAWQPIGETIQVPCSKSKRLNVLGFLNKENQLFPCMIEGKVDSACVIACFDAFSETIQKRTVVLIDRASVHTSKEFVSSIRRWVERGLIVKYLPPYSPHLNLIEILWRFIKYRWLPFSAYACWASLSAAVENILAQYGTDYSISFQSA